MSNATVSAVPTRYVTLSLAQQARVNLLMLSLAIWDSECNSSVETEAFVAAMRGVPMQEFDALHNEACAHHKRGLPLFGARVPPAKPFSHRTNSVEIDESAEAHLARGNQALQMRQYKRAYRSYLAALTAAERA